jgi:flagellar protein FliL
VAEEENKAEDGQESEGGSKKKLIIIIAIVGLLAVGISVGVTLFLLGGEEETVVEEVEAEPVKEPASYFAIKPAFLVTFDVEGRQRYMQISVSVSSRDASALDVLDHHMPLIRSRLLNTYADQDFQVVRTEEGKLALQAKTVEVINSVLGSEDAGEIENVYFTNFVLQ